MAWGKKDDKDKVVKFTEDKDRAKQLRDKAKTKLQQAGIEYKETGKGVGRDVAKTKRGQEAQQKREEINKHAARGMIDNTVNRKGKFQSEWD